MAASRSSTATPTWSMRANMARESTLPRLLMAGQPCAAQPISAPVGDLAQGAGRSPGNQGARRDVPSDDATGGDDGAIADRDALEHDDLRADQDMIANHNGFLLPVDPAIGLGDLMVVGVHDLTVPGDLTAVTNGYALGDGYATARTDTGSLADLQPSVVDGYLAMGSDAHAVAEHQFP